MYIYKPPNALFLFRPYWDVRMDAHESVHQLGPPFVFFWHLWAAKLKGWKLRTMEVSSASKQWVPDKVSGGSFWSSILNLRGVFWMNFQSLGEQQLFFLMLRETTLSKKSNWHNWWMVWLDMFMTLGCFSFLETFANGILDKRYQVLAEWGLPQNACCATRRAGGKTDEMKTPTLRTWQVYFCCKRLVRWLKSTIFFKLAHSLQGCVIGFINFAQVSRGLFVGPKFYGICAIAWFRQE